MFIFLPVTGTYDHEVFKLHPFQTLDPSLRHDWHQNWENSFTITVVRGEITSLLRWKAHQSVGQVKHNSHIQLKLLHQPTPFQRQWSSYIEIILYRGDQSTEYQGGRGSCMECGVKPACIWFTTFHAQYTLCQSTWPKLGEPWYVAI